MSSAITAAVAGAVVGGGIALVGASKSASAAKSAAQAQASSADKATQAQLEMYYQTREDQMPWLAHGMQSNNMLAGMLGLETPENLARSEYDYLRSNLTVGEDFAKTRANFDYNKFREMYPKAATWSDDKIWKQYLNSTKNYTFTPTDAATNTALGTSVDELTTKYTDIINSVTGGKVGGLLASFTPEDLQAGLDPGYEWRVQQGQQSLLSAAAASGMYGSGNMATALVDFGQNQASNEYQNAYNRWNTNRGQVYNMLTGMSGGGQTSANTLGNAGVSTANSIGQNYMTAGNATAAGYINSANAWNSGYQGLSNNLISGIGTIGNTIQGQNYFNNTGMAPAGSFISGGQVVAGSYRRGGRPPVGRPVIVGEEGVEVFVPDRPGYIVPHKEAINMLQRVRG